MDDEEEGRHFYFEWTTQFLSDQEIKDALETIPNKSMGSNSNEFWILSAQSHLFITVLIYSLRMEFIKKQ
jgi:hypothetical protein